MNTTLEELGCKEIVEEPLRHLRSAVDAGKAAALESMKRREAREFRGGGE